MEAHERPWAGTIVSASYFVLASVRNVEGMLVSLVEKRPWLGAMLAHLLFAMLLFSPFFLEGKIIVGSTDNYFGTWVNYLFSRTTLAAGDLGTWNPYVLGGIDFTASPHNHMACPLDWPLFLLPESWFLSGLTVQIFLLVWLCGVFSYLFFRQELGNAKWAFFASLLYQAGGYTFFSITTYSNTQLHVVNAVMLYLIWSADRRPPIVSYALWTLGLATIILAANPLYSFAGFFLILTLFAYRYWPGSLAVWRQQSPVLAFYAAAITSVILTAAHWLPITQSLLFAGSRLAGTGLRGGWGHTYLGLGAFVPEIFGVHFSDSIPLLHPLHAGGHAQFHGYPFFGVVGAFLIVLALRFKVPAAKFWVGFLLINTVWLLICPPFSALIDLLMVPLVHEIIPKVMIPVAFSVIAARAAMHIEGNWNRMTVKVSGLLMATIGVVVVLGITVWAFRHSVASFTDNEPIAAYHKMSVMGAKLVALLCSGLIAAVSWAVLRSAGGRGWSIWILWSAAPVVLLAFYLTSFARFGDVEPLNNNTFFESAYAFLAIATGAGVLAGAVVTACELGRLTRKAAVRILTLLIVGTAFAALWPNLASGSLRTGQLTLIMAIGMLKFAVLGSGMVYLLTSLARRPDLRPLLFPGLCALLLVDLLPYNKNYSRQITEAFGRAEQLYPDCSKLVRDEKVHDVEQKEQRIDPRHYRVNNPHVALKLAANELEANLPSIYGVRSYGGVNSDVPKGLVNLIRRFESLTPTASGVCAHFRHPTLLDLLGCGYDVDRAGELVERPTALSRFMLFHRFEVVDGGTVLDRLAAPGFVARDRLLLEAELGPGAANVDQAPEPMNYDSPRTSELIVHCKSEAPALLFFGDNYHPDWEALVDGRRRPVLRADSNFMAVAVPAGTSTVEFRFRPRVFEAGTAISGVSLAVFLVALPVAVWLRLRRRRAVTETAASVPSKPERFAA